MVTRFAGDDIANYLDKNRPNFGKVAMAADNMRTEEEGALTDMQAQVQSKGINNLGDIEATGIVADAEAAAAQSAANSQGMQSIVGGLTKGLGGMSFGGGGGSSFGSFGNLDTSNETGFFNPSAFG